jgi:hypothetical protein
MKILKMFSVKNGNIKKIYRTKVHKLQEERATYSKMDPDILTNITTSVHDMSVHSLVGTVP